MHSISDFTQVCRAIRTKLKTLTKTVESLISAHFASVLTVTSEPLMQLVAFHLNNRNAKEVHIQER